MSSVKTRGQTVPSADLKLSRLGLGCARIGGLLTGSSRTDDLDLLRAAFESGINVFDTADIYSQGESERLLGEAFSSTRDEVVIFSKVGYRLPRRKTLIQRVKPLLKPIALRLGVGRQHLPASLSGGYAGQCFDSEYLLSAVRASLRRLQTDRLDVVLLHSPPSEFLLSPAAAEAGHRLLESGMISKFGVSCASPADALTALAIDVVSFVQVELSLLHPETLVEVIPLARRLQKTVVTRQCFASGLLTWPPGDPRFASQPPVRLADLDRCRRVAEERNLPLGQAALGFTMGTAGIATTLLGAHTVSQLTENLRWANKELSADEYGALRAAACQP